MTRQHRISALLAAALVLSSAVTSFAASDKPGRPLVERMDSAIAAGARYIVRAQSPDGAWRSHTYSFFKDGPSLTPFVMSGLFFLPQGGQQAKSAYRSSVDYLVKMVREDGSIDEGEQGLTFPVLTAASASRVVVLYDKSERNLRAQAAWLAYLRKRQLNESLGWQHEDPEYGGWGFSLKLPKKPAPGEMKEMFFESNMVATIFGLAAFRSAKVPDTDPAYKQILVFASKCQNYPDDPKDADPKFDDGGFYFISNDPAQNKAGIAGKDSTGRERYYSYGSMSADGVRMLIRCGLPPTHPRVIAARKWLEWNFDAKNCPGKFARDREVLRNATYYYYCWAVAHAFSALQVRDIQTKHGKVNWAEEMAEELLKRQRPDGSWVNTFSDAREDDPLVSTPWAAAALAICREAITGEIKEMVPRRSPGPPIR